MNRIESEIRGPGLLGPHAPLEYRALVAGQPLILVRDPANGHDANAIIVKTLYSVPCGYLAKEHAAIVAPDMDAGTVWLAKVTQPKNAFKRPQIVVWKEAGAEKKFKRLAKAHGASDRTVYAILAGRFNREGE